MPRRLQNGLPLGKPSNRDSHAAQRAGSQWRMPQSLWLRLIVLHKPVTARRLVSCLPSQLPMHLPTGSLRQLLAYEPQRACMGRASGRRTRLRRERAISPHQGRVEACAPQSVVVSTRPASPLVSVALLVQLVPSLAVHASAHHDAPATSPQVPWDSTRSRRRVRWRRLAQIQMLASVSERPRGRWSQQWRMYLPP